MTKGNVNIIIVDNNSKQRDNLRSHLRIYNYGDIDYAKGGLHLLNLLESRPYHLVIIGGDMPDMSALEMVYLMRTKFDHDQLSIIFLYNKDIDRELILEMGLLGVIMCVTSDNYITQVQNRIKELQYS